MMEAPSIFCVSLWRKRWAAKIHIPDVSGVLSEVKSFKLEFLHLLEINRIQLDLTVDLSQYVL